MYSTTSDSQCPVKIVELSLERPFQRGTLPFLQAQMLDLVLIQDSNRERVEEQVFNHLHECMKNIDSFVIR